MNRFVWVEIISLKVLILFKHAKIRARNWENRRPGPPLIWIARKIGILNEIVSNAGTTRPADSADCAQRNRKQNDKPLNFYEPWTTRSTINGCHKFDYIETPHDASWFRCQSTVCAFHRLPVSWSRMIEEQRHWWHERRRANQPDKANHIWVIRSWQIFNELKAKHCWFASRFACPRTVRRVWIMFAKSRRLHIRSEHQARNLEQWWFTDEPSGKSSENSVLRDLAVLTDVRVQNYSL